MDEPTVLLRDTWAEVNLDAIMGNVQAVRRHVGHDVCVMAVVKANAYGHGACQVARAALQAGAAWLGVATLDEALELRQAGIEAPVLVFGYVSAQHAALAARQHITLTVISVQHAAELAEPNHLSDVDPLQVHVKIDSGMARIGLRNAEELLQALPHMLQQPGLRLTGAFTHLAQSDVMDQAYSHQQLQRVQDLFRILKHTVPDAGSLLLHAANSGGTLQLPDSHFNMVRLGISLYGVYPARHLRPSVPLTQALRLLTRIVMVKEVPVDTAIGYGSTFVTAMPARIATLPIGYADGLPRVLSNCGYVRIHGHKCPIVGRVCMDQTMVDVTSLTDVRVGDVATVYDDLSLVELAEMANTIPYELLCAISSRVPRKYWRSGQITSG